MNEPEAGPLVRSDAALLAAVARGDQSAFAELFDRHSVAVLRYAWAVLDDRGSVDDTVQEVFLTAWRRRRQLPDAESLLPWLLVTCRNVAMNANRRVRRTATVELSDASPLAYAQRRRSDHDDALEQLAWVGSELAALSELERRLCELCLIEGVPYEAAAAEVGLTAAAARKRVQRVRGRLRAARDEGAAGLTPGVDKEPRAR